MFRMDAPELWGGKKQKGVLKSQEKNFFSPKKKKKSDHEQFQTNTGLMQSRHVTSWLKFSPADLQLSGH